MTLKWIPRLSAKQRLGLGGAALLAIGAAGGAGAMSLTRPTVEMAPTVPTAVAKLADARGIVTVRGRVAEVYGDRFIVQDQTGRVLVDAGRGASGQVTAGKPILVQGRFEQAQLKARFLVDDAGNVEEVGPPPPHGRGPHPHDAPPPGRDGPPPPPPGGSDGAPPPPPGAAPPPPPGARAAAASAPTEQARVPAPSSAPADARQSTPKR